MASPSTRREGIDDTFSLDDVFALLDAGFFDEDDEIQESINSMDTELEEKANPTLLPCEICGKMLKSSAGLKRHTGAKHPEKALEHAQRKQDELNQEASNILNPEQIKSYAFDIYKKLSEDELYPESIRESFKLFSFDQADEIFRLLRDVILMFKGDCEKFLIQFNKIMQKVHIQEFNNVISQLFKMELSTVILNHLKSHKEEANCTTVVASLSENEFAALQYLAGHVIHKSYTRLRKRKNWKNYQQSIDILKACKIEPNDSHKLVASKDRGGLWYISQETENLFLAAEKMFRKRTEGFVTGIYYREMVGTLIQDSVVKSNYDKILFESGISKTEYSENLLETILGLYLRIRCHSYAKDIKEKQKIKKKELERNARCVQN